MQRRHRLQFKVLAALRAADVPRWLHRFGPRKFTTAQLVLGLAVRARWARSYREATRFLDEHYGLVVHWTTLQKFASRVPLALWHAILRATADLESMLAAIDATGFSRSNPSAHYLHRIDGATPSVPIKMSIMVDTSTRRVLAARVRVRPAHETRDVFALCRRASQPPLAIVMDKAYDSEPLLERLDKAGIWGIAPPRAGCRHGPHRLQLRDAFPVAEYAQRSIVESVFSAIKQRYGGHVRGRTARTVRAELYLKLALYNLSTLLRRLFLHRRAGRLR